MKEFKEEPIFGKTEDKIPTTICIKHADLPGIDEAALGDRVKLVIEGHIRAQRAADTFGDGNAEVDIHSIQHAEPVKKENAATMHMDKLKEKLPKKEEETPEEEKSKDEEKE
jgi:hypothetical protein